MAEARSVSVVIPAFNEAGAIAGVIAGLNAAATWHEIIVVDDGSTDDTGAIATKAGARVIRHPYTKGNGAAVKSGAGDKDQLASCAGLDPLRNGKQMLGGFLSGAPFGQSVSTFVQGVQAIEPGAFGSQMLALAQALNGLPNRGQTPIFITANGAPGATTKLSLAIDMQQGTFEDARSLAVSAYSFFSRMGLLP
jgi:hypothetical protein